MAIAFAQVKYLSRSKALQATAAAAYRSCSKIHDERTGQTFDYTNKKSHVIYSEILLPKDADDKFKNREFLWNTVEKNETRRNSQVAKEVVLALPRDDAITNEDKIELARRFAINHFVSKGVAVDINIHNDGDNPHAHILVTTRRLINNQFDTHKARDLDPKVIHGKVQVDKVWGDEWRHFQNNYFLDKGMDLTVDADGIYSQVHLGKHVYHAKVRDKLDVWRYNQESKHGAKQIALTDPEAVLNQLTLHHAVFTENDIARLLHKHIDSAEEFQLAFIEVKYSKQLISLGAGEDGKERFTTSHLFDIENNLQGIAGDLNNRYQHSVRSSIVDTVIKSFQLNEEQSKAIRHVLQGSDISVIVGRAGTGKTYALRAVNEAYSKAGYKVHGLALSGIAAQGLQDAANIKSRTITSFSHGIRNGSLQLSDKDIIILDEAGMTDNVALADVIQSVHTAKAKIVLVGDEAQLQPIGPGAPFRALLECVGFAELQSIIRQEETWQRNATHHLATGNIKEALEAYQTRDCIKYDNTSKAAMHNLIEDWHSQYVKEKLPLNKMIILAHQNHDVRKLNQLARAKRVLAGEIDNGVLVKKEDDELWLSTNDRVLFLKNDSAFGVKNGQFGTVKAIDIDKEGFAKSLTIKLDNQQNIIFDPQKYQHFTYGYSATVHKTQGVTVDHSFVFINGKYWNKNLIYVAGSRHRKNMDLYINQEVYPNYDTLSRGLERSGMKDNALDYPLNFAKRRGIDNESLFEKFKQHALNKLRVAKNNLLEAYRLLIKPQRIKSYEKEKIANHKKPQIILQDKDKVDDNQPLQSKYLKLFDDLARAKQAKNHYAVYRLNKELRSELSKIYKDKKLISEIQKANPQLAKRIAVYVKGTTHEIET
jgi:Ti-type conjugative transfer relaxase TraA